MNTHMHPFYIVFILIAAAFIYDIYYSISRDIEGKSSRSGLHRIPNTQVY